jgi:hypothetical protein
MAYNIRDITITDLLPALKGEAFSCKLNNPTITSIEEYL